MHFHRKHRSTFAAALCAGLMIAAPPFAAAQSGPGPDQDGGNRPHHERGGHRHGGPFIHALRALDLSATQKDSVDTAIKAQWQSARSEHEALHRLHRAVEVATPDQADYGSLVSQLADAEANASRDRVQRQSALKAQLYAMLTPAQKAALTEQLKNLPEPPARLERGGRPPR